MIYRYFGVFLSKIALITLVLWGIAYISEKRIRIGKKRELFPHKQVKFCRRLFFIIKYATTTCFKGGPVVFVLVKAMHSVILKSESA